LEVLLLARPLVLLSVAPLLLLLVPLPPTLATQRPR
jgi:hypothetical protein